MLFIQTQTNHNNSFSASLQVSVYPAYVQSTVSQGSGSAETPATASTRTDGSLAVEHKAFQQQNSSKRARWESCSSETAMSGSSGKMQGRVLFQ